MSRQEQFDTIIIGSGISGMAAGIILAKEGEKVLVLEQHTLAGGLTQTFKRGGLVFPTGVHRLGALNPGQPLWYFFQYLGLMDRLAIVPMSGRGFESYYFPGCSFTVPQGRRAYKAKLLSLFPGQAEAIHTYFKDMDALVNGIRLYNPGQTGRPDRSRDFTGPLDDYLVHLGIHGHLKSIICANNPLFGLPTSQCPVMTHFIVSDAYLNSSFRINEAATPFSLALVQCLEAAGGTLRTNSLVTRLQIEDRTVRGVELDSGETLAGARVIYSGHPCLLPGLCPPKTFRPVYRKRLESAENTPGMFGVGLKWEKKNCPVADNDAYIYDTWDVNGHYDQTNADEKNSGMIFLSALPGKSNDDKDLAVTALTCLSARDYDRLKIEYAAPGKQDYKKVKLKIAEKIMARIEQTFPGTGFSLMDTYSPATFHRYTLTPEGSAYGIKKTAQTFLQTMFSPATRVKGLFLTGQNIGFSGIHGAVSASFNLCQNFFPESYLMNKLSKQGKETL